MEARNMENRIFTILENNPKPVNQLAHALGLSTKFAFHDVYSLTDPDLLSMMPRPVYALLAIIPMTPTWNEARIQEDEGKGPYAKSGPDEPVIWFKQTIIEGCGSVGTIHCALNGGPSDPDLVLPGSELERIRNEAIPLQMMDRAFLLNKSDFLYDAHQAAAATGDTRPPNFGDPEHQGQHFVAFVKGKDGHLHELEGSREGPLDRGVLSDDEDMLSERAIRLGIGRLIEQEKRAGGDLRFSCTALTPVIDE